MSFVLLWLECVAVLLLWLALAIAWEAQLPAGLRRWTTVAGLAGIAVASCAELAGTLGVAVLLKLSFAIGFFISVAAVFFIGGGLLAFRGLRAESPGLPPRAAGWPWKRIALLLAVASGLAVASLHDMRIAAEQELSRALADLRELEHQLDPPVPATLNAAPLYETAWKHIVAMDKVPGAREAMDALEATRSPSREQILAAPLADWVKENEIALALVIEATHRPAYSTLEESAFRIPPVSDQSRFAKVAELELRGPRPDPRVVGHLTERGRAMRLLEIAALRDATQGPAGRAIDETNALLVLNRQTHYTVPPPDEVVEKLLKIPGLADADLKRLDLHSDVTMKMRLQRVLIESEIRDLEGLSFMQSGSWSRESGRSNSLENLATALLDLSRGFIDVLGTDELIARGRASYDALWEALYASPSERLTKLESQKPAWTFFSNPLSFRHAFARAAADEARRACAEVGVAAARYRLAQGHAPAALGDLVPAWLLELPSDPFNGQPLQYKSDASGIVISSSGHDDREGKDEISFHLAANP